MSHASAVVPAGRHRYLPAPGETAADLLATLDDMGDDAVAEGTLDVVEATIRDRRLHAVRVPTW
ncbi:hypothetical protein [Nostocoides australiense]|nr:hypothetical protein [Actinomycetota bacterium]